jgi:hypothetical protein
MLRLSGIESYTLRCNICVVCCQGWASQKKIADGWSVRDCRIHSLSILADAAWSCPRDVSYPGSKWPSYCLVMDKGFYLFQTTDFTKMSLHHYCSFWLSFVISLICCWPHPYHLVSGSKQSFVWIDENTFTLIQAGRYQDFLFLYTWK